MLTSNKNPAQTRFWNIARIEYITIIATSLAFVIGHPLARQYFSNQNTKFLHGLASAFPERLGNDWTAATADGLPLFSYLVYLIARFATPSAFYFLELLFQFGFALSLILILRFAANGKIRPFDNILAGAFLVALTWAGLHTFLRGVAGQYITTGYLQPSCFGILFLIALVLAQRRHSAAIVLAAAPAMFHSTYIAPGLILAGLFVWDQRHKPAARLLPAVVVAAIFLIAPPLDIALRFSTGDPEIFAQANEILAFIRIPHHSLPADWFDVNAAIKTGIVITAILLAPASIIRTAMIALFSFAVIGTLGVVVTKDSGLALLAPWRVSVILVPVSCAILFGVFLDPRKQFLRAKRILLIVLGAAAIIAVIEGANQKVQLLSAKAVPDHIAFIRSNARTEDVYLTSPGHSEFRLEAMAAQFVSWKTHPYLATEVLEWKRRIDLARAVYGKRKRGEPRLKCTALATLLEQYDISHVVARPNSENEPAVCPFLTVVFNGQDGVVTQVVQP